MAAGTRQAAIMAPAPEAEAKAPRLACEALKRLAPR
jgi:hypothetical protein